MNKTIWMCWFQGKNHKSIRKLNATCLRKWQSLNPEWQVNILDNTTIEKYVPEYFDILKRAKYKRGRPHRADLLRLLLLSRYGGVWADASLYPVTKLDDWLHDAINYTGFFTYRFSPRNRNRETVVWFLAVNQPNHILVKAWCAKFIDSFVNCDNFIYYQMHKDLSFLCDTNEDIKNIIENMVQISQQIPHSAQRKLGWEGRVSSFMYKRPKLPKDFKREEWGTEDPFIDSL